MTATPSALPAFSIRTRDLHASPIREILAVVDRPGMISFAGGLPSGDTFPRLSLDAMPQTALIFIIGTLALAWAVRRHRRTFVLTLVAAVCVSAAFFVVWIVFVAPVNSQTAQWTAATLPADWTRWRAQWEYAHAARFGLQFIGFSALVISFLFDAKTTGESVRAG